MCPFIADRTAMLTKSWESFPLGHDLHPIALNGIERSYIIDKTDKCNSVIVTPKVLGL